jgi:hypothetical protein
MKIRRAPYQEGLSELDEVVVSGFFSDPLDSFLSAPDAAES